MANLGRLAQEEGNLASARAWYERAAAAGSTHAMIERGRLDQKIGDVDGAGDWYQRAVDAGSNGGM